MSKTFRQYLGLDSFDRDANGVEMSHRDKYEAIVKALGYEDVKRCIPFDIVRVKKALANGDEHLNTLSIKSWDVASGFYCKGGDCTYIGSPLTALYRKIGVNAFSNAGGVCVLKECARMWAEEVN